MRELINGNQSEIYAHRAEQDYMMLERLVSSGIVYDAVILVMYECMMNYVKSVLSDNSIKTENIDIVSGVSTDLTYIMRLEGIGLDSNNCADLICLCSDYSAHLDFTGGSYTESKHDIGTADQHLSAIRNLRSFCKLYTLKQTTVADRILKHAVNKNITYSEALDSLYDTMCPDEDKDNAVLKEDAVRNFMGE